MSMMPDRLDDTPLLAPPPPSLRPPSKLFAELYGVQKWGPPYFSVNSFGNISVRPEAESNDEIDLLEVVKEATSMAGAGLRLPLFVRFPGVLKNRLESLHHAFEIAIRNQGYRSRYQGVYPVKCNQDRFIVEDIVKFGSTFRFGLEAGSKPELLLAMSCLCKGSPEAYLVCNGFKDSEYVSLALIAQKLNFDAFIVLELEEELELILDLALKLGIETPLIGVRAKLQAQHNGHFGSTSGQNGKFGLTKPQIYRIADELKRRGKLDCLQLLHFHMGSQIPSKERLYHGVSEGAQIYCDLAEFGAKSMRIIDVGGGLGVDYDGSKSDNSEFSVEYTLEEYADTVVHAVREVCDRWSVGHPVICSESGRAIVSHHSILIFEAFSTTKPASKNVVSMSIWNSLSSTLSLCCRRTTKPSVIKAYHVNLSIFTSIPDFWGIKHLFPILPIHHLDEMPNVRGTLSDLTCDSDGVMAKFIGGNDSLMLHELEKGKGYYLGMFLGGAYQEALGGHHNLFGRPSAVQVTKKGPRGFRLQPIPGRSCGDVLRVMHHDPEVMKMTLKKRADKLGHGILVDSLDRSFGNMPYLFRVKDQMNKNGDSDASSSKGENGLSDGGVESFYI